ncbi:MAG: PEP-CTERM/exosortase system-associated acyltransferase, partial [Candidatus Marinimicrobia bacterium]|nr:PEP-CTERM/exosortase system-associated acyltransferase [Candidatus Neomarinimicrobiota bacterium]
HEVYCKELGWEAEDKDGLEKDSYDSHSLHCLLKSVKTGKFIGCIRVILPSHAEQEPMLPFQKVCAIGLNTGHPDPVELANDTTAEVSRLAIIAEYRRRKNEQGCPVAINDSDYAFDERRKFPYIPVGLYLGMLQMAFIQGIHNLYFLTEPHLARHFSRLGGRLEPVGEGIDHRGLRIPYRMNVCEVLKGLHLLVRPLKKAIEQEVTAQMKV